jgi:hypothetical protein
MNSSKILSRQRGFLTFCFIVNVSAFALAGYFVLKLASPYLEYRVMANAVDEVVRLNNINSLHANKIRSKMKESVSRNSGINPTKLNVDHIVYVASRDGRKVVGIDYEVVVGLFYNISALLHFKHEKLASPRVVVN